MKYFLKLSQIKMTTVTINSIIVSMKEIEILSFGTGFVTIGCLEWKTILQNRSLENNLQ